MLGYVPMDSISDIDSEINALKEGIKADRLLAKTELGKEFKIWVEKRPHLTDEEIVDIQGTIAALKRKEALKEYNPKTEAGMSLATWTKENIGITDEDMKFFWGDHAYITYLISATFTKWLTDRLANCLAINYPIEIKQRTIKTSQGPADWPGIPMDKLELPIPSPPLTIPQGSLDVKHTATVWFGMLPPGVKEGLMARVIIY